MPDKVLVVDDEEKIRNLLSAFLAKEGYEVIVAANGEEALELVATANPQVVLLDVTMPGVDGIEVCERLKTDEKTRLIPVIVATAYQDSASAALEVGADDFVSKPVQLLELSVRIRSILQIKHLTDELERAKAYTLELQKNLPK